MSTADQIRRQARDSYAEARPWVVWLARLGHAAKGIVYIIVGVLGLEAASGTGGRTTDTRGALVEIITQPFGEVLLAVVALGLVGYALWRIVEAIMDPERKGTDAKGIVKRTGYGVSGIIYAGLAFGAVQLILGSEGGDGNRAEDWTAKVLAQPFGRWLIALAGLAVIGAAVHQLYNAWSADFQKTLRLGEMNPTQRAWTVRIGRFGLAARGVVFGIIGWFLIRAALRYDPQEAGGLGEALQALARQPYGPWLLGAVAVGLVAYGIYALILARYRRIYV